MADEGVELEQFGQPISGKSLERAKESEEGFEAEIQRDRIRAVYAILDVEAPVPGPDRKQYLDPHIKFKKLKALPTVDQIIEIEEHFRQRWEDVLDRARQQWEKEEDSPEIQALKKKIKEETEALGAMLQRRPDRRLIIEESTSSMARETFSAGDDSEESGTKLWERRDSVTGAVNCYYVLDPKGSLTMHVADPSDPDCNLHKGNLELNIKGLIAKAKEQKWKTVKVSANCPGPGGSSVPNYVLEAKIIREAYAQGLEVELRPDQMQQPAIIKLYEDHKILRQNAQKGAIAVGLLDESNPAGLSERGLQSAKDANTDAPSIGTAGAGQGPSPSPESPAASR